MPRNTYRTADGRWVAVSTSADSVATRVMELIGLGDDERFADFAGRVAHRAEVDERMERWMAERTLQEVLDQFDRAHAAAAAVYDMADIFADPHYRERGDRRGGRVPHAEPGGPPVGDAGSDPLAGSPPRRRRRGHPVSSSPPRPTNRGPRCPRRAFTTRDDRVGRRRSFGSAPGVAQRGRNRGQIDSWVTGSRQCRRRQALPRGNGSGQTGRRI